MRILMLPRFGIKGANSRYRFWQYVPLLREQGATVEVRPMLGDEYLSKLYVRGKRPVWPSIKGYLYSVARLWDAGKYDAILLDQEVAPYLPSAIESSLKRLNSTLIVDYDDAAYFKYSNRCILRSKIARIMSLSRTVVVGNHYLAEYARQFSSDVRLIPTVVDHTKYSVKVHGPVERVRVCWIGTPITAARFLKPMLPVFSALQGLHPMLQFRFIGAGSLNWGTSLNVEHREWADDTEAASVAECDIGIMPLPDDEFERGKCGLKLLQYMAAGLPVVASPVGENRFIVADDLDGYLACNAEDWFRKLALLIRDHNLRTRMGTEGRKKVEERYSIMHGFSLWMNVLATVGGRLGRQLPLHSHLPNQARAE